MTKKTKATLNFIAKAKERHGGRYLYEDVEYKNNQTKVKIECPNHGVFMQTPNSHLSGKGCYQCSGKKRMDIERFLVEAANIHGDRYDYRNVVISGVKGKVEIICGVHGKFSQRVDAHLKGMGCIECGKEKKARSCRKDTEWFISKATSVHGGRYDYSDSVYVKSHDKVAIRCRVHGVFHQKPATHIRGEGCYFCAERGFRDDKDSYVYMASSGCGKLIKFGITNNPQNRLTSLKRATPFEISKFDFCSVNPKDARKIERDLINSGDSAELSGFDGCTEWVKRDEIALSSFLMVKELSKPL